MPQTFFYWEKVGTSLSDRMLRRPHPRLCRQHCPLLPRQLFRQQLPLTPTPTIILSPTPVDIIPPSANITSPRNNSFVRRNSRITISASASDTESVAKVEFYINGTRIFTDASSPYSAVWNVPSARYITYSITAKAYDTTGNFASSTIQVTSY